MTDEVKRCVESCREWYVAFSSFGKSNESSVKELLDTADMIESISAELEQVKRERDEAWNVVEAISNQNEAMAVAMEKVKRERDALQEEIDAMNEEYFTDIHTARDPMVDKVKQLERERDALLDDLSAHRPCDACGLYELQGVICMQCRRHTERPCWKWRGVKED